MNPAQKMLLVSFLLLGSFSVHSEIRTYQSTDNTGENKYERINTVEKYLIDLSNSLKSMESKLDENAKKIQALDSTIKTIKDKQEAMIADSEAKKKKESKLGESKTSPAAPDSTEQSELDKLKADVLSLKNHDIERLKVNLEDLSDTVKAMQSTLRTQNK
jgi:chromosome segregation ATPase